MNVNLLKGCIASLIITTSTLASAGTIDVTQSETLYELGGRNTDQLHFIWNFEGLTEEIKDITLKFEWSNMDFTDKVTDSPTEYFTIMSNSTSIGNIGDALLSNANEAFVSGGCEVAYEGDPDNEWGSDCDGSKTFNLNDSSLWSNSILNITALNNYIDVKGYTVQSNGLWSDFSTQGYVTASISYSIEEKTTPNKVPEPSSLTMIVLGLMGLVVRKMKKNS